MEIDFVQIINSITLLSLAICIGLCLLSNLLLIPSRIAENKRKLEAQISR